MGALCFAWIGEEMDRLALDEVSVWLYLVCIELPRLMLIHFAPLSFRDLLLNCLIAAVALLTQVVVFA